jgi:alpha-amylase/alpha-mannosidase (GH57 family)
MADISFALVLNLHQPARNLEDLVEHKEWEAREILWAIDRIPRSLWAYEDIGRVHLSLSGTLLETLSSPDFQQRVYGIVDCGSLLWYLQNQRVIKILGTAYYHPVLPLIPRLDWDAQIERWQGIGRHLLGRDTFAGFWPPEMGFSMELIPILRRYGYRYVLVDSEHVQAVTPMRWDELRYRPHIARFGGQEIVVVVRDRELSDAQLAGMEPAWFVDEVVQRTRYCHYPPLVTTCTDGENGGWFRNTTHAANFWGGFYEPLLDRARANQSAGMRPAFIDDYLMLHGAHGEVSVGPGAWNTGWHHGTEFVQWTGSAAQQHALTRLGELTQAIYAARRNAVGVSARNPEVYRLLEEAYWRVLRAETSCNFFWGEAWVQRCHDDLDRASSFLEAANSQFSSGRELRVSS